MTVFWAAYWTFGWATAFAALLYLGRNPALEHQLPEWTTRAAYNFSVVTSCLIYAMVWPVIWYEAYDRNRWRG